MDGALAVDRTSLRDDRRDRDEVVGQSSLRRSFAWRSSAQPSAAGEPHTRLWTNNVKLVNAVTTSDPLRRMPAEAARRR
jgi:hypothetical protein